MEIDQGGAAFPHNVELAPGIVGATGMRLRDYFAAKAMEGILARCDWHVQANDVAAKAYALADAMIAARRDRV